MSVYGGPQYKIEHTGGHERIPNSYESQEDNQYQTLGMNVVMSTLDQTQCNTDRYTSTSAPEDQDQNKIINQSYQLVT